MSNEISRWDEDKRYYITKFLIDQFLEEYVPKVNGDVVNIFADSFQYSGKHPDVHFCSAKTQKCVKAYLALFETILVQDSLNDLVLQSMGFDKATNLVLGYFQHIVPDEDFGRLTDYLVLWQAEEKMEAVHTKLKKHFSYRRTRPTTSRILRFQNLIKSVIEHGIVGLYFLD